MKHMVMSTSTLALTVVLAVGCATAACASASPGADGGAGSPDTATTASAAPTPDLTISVDAAVDPRALLRAPDLLLRGTQHASLAVVTTDGGRLTSAPGPTGGNAIRFPAFSKDDDGPDAILKLKPTGGDWMSPRQDALTMGLELKLDQVSDGTKRDNGDNVLQRGLYVDDAQYKLQMDHHRASCVMRGSAGRVMAALPDRLAADQWYRVSCRRTAGTVKLVVATLDDKGRTTQVRSASASGSIGSMDFDLTAPLSVGGKLKPDGSPAAATDQFNGVLDDVYVTVG